MGPPQRRATPVYGYQVVHAYPHDRGAFTEGLFYQDGWLYESTGMEGRSDIRKVALETGVVAQKRAIDPRLFGEGIVAWKGKLVELTWRTEIGFTYDLNTFQPTGEFHYPGEGWALTTDGRRLIMSDGSSEIRFLDPDTLQQTGELMVKEGKEPLLSINELEWVKGEIWANVWQTDRIARIDPMSGQVLGWIDLSGLLPARDRNGTEDVLNGIAYDAAGDRVFVTGKQWPKLYEIKLTGPR